MAARLAELAVPGDLVLLAGELGAGKTAFSQGFGAALGVTDAVTSPTFTLMNRYDGGRLVMYHLDVYRLGQLGEVLDLGLPEILDEQAVTLIEWGDVIASVLPADHLVVRLSYGSDDEQRRVELSAVGTRWARRVDDIAAALDDWMVDEGPGGL